MLLKVTLLPNTTKGQDPLVQQGLTVAGGLMLTEFAYPYRLPSRNTVTSPPKLDARRLAMIAM